MGINVTFYRFSKKTNSTKIPYAGQTVFTFEASQEGTGTPSPDNIRPILPGFSFERDDHSIVNVYGGSLDVTSGVLTVTHGTTLFDGSESWSKNGETYDYINLVSTVSDLVSVANSDTVVRIKADKFNGVSANTALGAATKAAYQIAVISNSRVYVVMPKTVVDSAAAFKTWLESNNVQIVYELAQPITIQLTYNELKRCCDQLGIPYPVHIPVTYQAYDCELLDNTTIQNPGIRLDMYGGTASPFDFNYAYIPQFQRYYWVNAIEYDLGTWIFSLEVDVLGSLRDKIGSSEQYIMRSSADYDGTITDSTYPIKNAFDSETVIWTLDTLFGSTDGLNAWYVVGIIGGLSHEAYAYYSNLHLTPSELYNGSVIYFVLDNAQLRELMSMLLGNVQIYDIETAEMSEALAKQLLNPIQYIESIRCVPFKPDVMAYNETDILVDKIQFGFTLLDVNDIDPEPTPPVPPNDVEDEEDVTPQAVQAGWRILRRPRITYPLRNISSGEGWIRHHAFTMNLPVHPQKSRGAWVKGSPTSSYTIEMEPFGMIQIPGNVPIQAKEKSVIIEQGVTIRAFTIKFEAWTDVVTGMCKLIISFQDSDNNWQPFYNDSRDISVTLPCHQSIQDASSYFRTWTNQNAASHNKWLDWITGIFGGISGSYQTQSGAGASSSIGVGAGAVGGIMSFGQSVNNYYRATKPQNMLSMLEANMPQISGEGASGGSYISFASDFCSPRVHCYFSLLTADNLFDHGRPLCDFRTISAIPGYIECDHAHLNDDDIPLTAIEREDALNFMNGGFYYE